MLSILICVSDHFLRFLIFWDLKDIAKKNLIKIKLDHRENYRIYGTATVTFKIGNIKKV